MQAPADVSTLPYEHPVIVQLLEEWLECKKSRKPWKWKAKLEAQSHTTPSYTANPETYRCRDDKDYARLKRLRNRLELERAGADAAGHQPPSTPWALVQTEALLAGAGPRTEMAARTFWTPFDGEPLPDSLELRWTSESGWGIWATRAVPCRTRLFTAIAGTGAVRDGLGADFLVQTSSHS